MALMIFTLLAFGIVVASPFIGIYIGVKTGHYGGDMAMISIITTAIGGCIAIILILVGGEIGDA